MANKVFITDEVSDSRTVDVTVGKRLKVERGASNFHICQTAQTLISAEAIYDGACFLERIILGNKPATAATFTIYDTYASASHVSAFGSSGSNVAVVLGLDASSAVVTGADAGHPEYPKSLDIGVYLATGLSVGISCCAADSLGRIGTLQGATVIYQT